MTQTAKQKIEALGTELIRGYDSSESWKKALLEDPLKIMKAVGFETHNVTNNELQIFFMDNQKMMDEAYNEVHTQGIFGCWACKIGIIVVVTILVTALAGIGVTAGVAVKAGASLITASLTQAALILGTTGIVLISILEAIRGLSFFSILDAICKWLGFCP